MRHLSCADLHTPILVSGCGCSNMLVFALCTGCRWALEEVRSRRRASRTTGGCSCLCPAHPVGTSCAWTSPGTPPSGTSCKHSRTPAPSPSPVQLRWCHELSLVMVVWARLRHAMIQIVQCVLMISSLYAKICTQGTGERAV